jgi:hypothetical protein
MPRMFKLLKSRLTSPQTDAAVGLVSSILLMVLAVGLLLVEFRNSIGWMMLFLSSVNLFNLWINWDRIAEGRDPR